MTPDEIQIVEMPPPDMPAALYANAVDAYCTGEPFGAAAQRAGYARPLRMTRDEWRNYICCVLTVREELIAENRPLVQDLVNHVLGAGSWLDAQQENRDKAVADRRRRASTSTRTRTILALRDGEPDRPRDLRRPAHDPRGVRRADAALDRGRHDRSARSRTSSYVDESFASDAQPARDRDLSARALAALLAARAARGAAARAPTRRAQGGRLRSAARGARVRAARLGRQRAHARAATAARWWCSGSASPRAPTSARRRSRRSRRRARSSARRPASVQVVYVTVDPERDDAERLRTYLREVRSDLPRRHRHGRAARGRAQGVRHRGGSGQRGRQLRVQPLVVHVPDRPRGQAARADAVRHSPRRLRARPRRSCSTP